MGFNTHFPHMSLIDSLIYVRSRDTAAAAAAAGAAVFEFKHIHLHMSTFCLNLSERNRDNVDFFPMHIAPNQPILLHAPGKLDIILI